MLIGVSRKGVTNERCEISDIPVKDLPLSVSFMFNHEVGTFS